MIWPGDQGISGNDPRLWDPETASVSLLKKPGYDLFCSGHSFLADGQLLVSGGHIQNNIGLPNASLYNPFTDTWTTLPNMNAGRWYPTNTTLANGDVLVISGSVDLNVGANPLPQVFQAATGSWRNLTSAQLSLDLYPRMHLAPNGKVFNSSPSPTTRYLDTTGTGNWTVVANRSLYRDYGGSVLYDGKVLIMGGSDPPVNSAEIIDLTSPSPAWRSVAPMVFARRHLNSTLLPDGKIFVNGGTSGPGWDNPDFPIYPAEMWDPATETWATMASAQIPRRYHSAAALLPDGRVITTGGNGFPQVEIYEPPYLFKGTRPTITSAPTDVAYGQTFFVQTPDGASITTVNTIKNASVTHAFNTEQRINHLVFSQAPGGLNITAPSDPNLAPPGYYMLFILNAGVPSIAKIIHLGATGGGTSLVPALTSISPNSAISGGPGFNLTVTGTDFLIGAVVQWNGSPRPTTFVSSTQLTAAISSNDIAVAGAASVNVVNPGGTTSNSLSFVITQSSVTTGLVAAYGFDEGTGTSVGDASGNGRTGAITGAAWTTGKFGNALSFNGTTSYVSVANPNLPTGDFTWIAWIKPGQTSAFMAIMVSHGIGASPGGLELDLSSGKVNVWSNGNLALASATTIANNVWTHVALTRAGGTFKLYVNGNPDNAFGADTVANDFAGCALLIGVDNDSGCTGSLNGNFSGGIDEVRIYNRPLSQSEIQTYMNVPVGAPVADTTPPDTIITVSPVTPNKNTTASFSFASTEADGTFQCQLDPNEFGGGFVACTSPQAYSNLAAGAHTFLVRAIDQAGNVDPTPASFNWTIDLTPPTIAISAPTSNASYSTGMSPLTLGGTSGDNNAVSLITWSNDRGGSGTASGTANWTASGIALQSGVNVLTATARDAAGNTASATLTVTYTVADTTPPTRSNGAPSGTLAAGTTQTALGLTTNENAVCRYATSAGVAYASMPNTFATTGGTSHSTTVGGLSNGGSYSYYVRCQDSSGNANPDDFSISFSVAQQLTTITAFPASAVVLTGTLNSGNASSLNSDNNVYFVVNSTTSGTRTTSWYGSFTGTSTSLANLKVNYKGKTSSSCTQTVAILRWTDNTWVQLDSRSVSTTEVAINNLAPTGTLANYVSGTGELRVRVQCTRTGNFTASGDLMSIVYDAPVAPPPPDTTPPTRSNGTPSGTLASGTTQTTLSLTTNENALCRYATTAGVAYGSMPNAFATTGGTAHSTVVSGLTDGGSFNYYVRCQDGSGNANSDDFPIAFSVAVQGAQITYQASTDFSSTQGFQNWFYLYGAGTQMTFAGGNWQGNETFLSLYADGGHPGNLSDAIRRWKAPQAGSITITGNVFDQDSSCGAGDSVYIKKNATVLWQQAIANGNTTGVPFNVTTAVAAGDNIDFGINRGADNVWDCDGTGFDPKIVLTP